MNFWRLTAKVFAFYSLIFLSFISINAQTDSIYQLRSGTRIQVRMDNEINSKVSGANDTFTATIAEPVKIRDSVVLTIGMVIEGRIIQVKRAASGGKDGTMKISFETIRFADGNKREIEAMLVDELKTESSQTAKVLTIIGGSAVGGILGAVSKADKGFLIGAGIGAGTGLGIAYLRKGEEVRIKASEKFEIELTKDVTLPVRDF